MRKIVFGMTTGFVGMDATRLVPFDYNPTVAELNDIASDLAQDNAQMYGIEEYPEDYNEDEDDGSTYSEGIEGWWREYNEEKDSWMEEEPI